MRPAAPRHRRLRAGARARAHGAQVRGVAVRVVAVRWSCGRWVFRRARSGGGGTCAAGAAATVDEEQSGAAARRRRQPVTLRASTANKKGRSDGELCRTRRGIEPRSMAPYATMLPLHYLVKCRRSVPVLGRFGHVNPPARCVAWSWWSWSWPQPAACFSAAVRHAGVAVGVPRPPLLLLMGLMRWFGCPGRADARSPRHGHPLRGAAGRSRAQLCTADTNVTASRLHVLLTNIIYYHFRMCGPVVASWGTVHGGAVRAGCRSRCRGAPTRGTLALLPRSGSTCILHSA